jgi:hypothetical protein
VLFPCSVCMFLVGEKVTACSPTLGPQRPPHKDRQAKNLIYPRFSYFDSSACHQTCSLLYIGAATAAAIAATATKLLHN